MKVLITGGAGFIGSHLADRLLAAGHRVLVIDNYVTGRRDNLTAREGLEVVEGSIVDKGLVERLFHAFRPERVVHAAASYKDPQDWAQDSLTNVVGTANVVQAAAEVAVSRLLYFQTALCYGIHPREQPITLKHPLRPGDSSYAISKTAGEYYVMLSDLDWVSLRLANVYGPRNLSGPLPTFFHRLTEKKPCWVMDTRRDFVFVDDLIEVAVKAIEGEGRKGVYHVSSGSDHAIKELFDETVRALGMELEEDVEVRPRSSDDAPSILLDPAETEKDFGWRARTPLALGVSAAVSWYKDYGVHQTYTHLKIGEKSE